MVDLKRHVVDSLLAPAIVTDVAPTPSLNRASHVSNPKDEPEVTAAKSKTAAVDAKKPADKEGMDLMTWYALMRENQPEPGVKETDSDFSKGFETFVKTMGLEDVKIKYEGKETTLGEISHRMANLYGGDLYASGYPQGTLGSFHLEPGSPLAAKSVATAEMRAQKSGVLGVIQEAAAMTGADYKSLLMIAQQESGFRAGVKAATSSATGLYQFLNKTWEAEIIKHGDLLRKAGIDPATASASDPRANALMGAAYYMDNKQSLEKSLGHSVGAGEVYMAHFLGEGGAKRYFHELEKNPHALASAVMPGAAGSNSFMNGQTLLQLGQNMAHKVGAELKLTMN